jgi:uncharacterized protein YkwD
MSDTSTIIRRYVRRGGCAAPLTKEVLPADAARKAGRPHRAHGARRALLAALLVAVALVASGCALLAQTAPSLEWTNGQRDDAGVPLLRWDAQLAVCAEAWADELATRRTLEHGDLLSCKPDGATKLGENLASGVDLQAAYRAILESPAHRKNMLEPTWTRFGIGLARFDGTVYLVWRFANG